MEKLLCYIIVPFVISLSACSTIKDGPSVSETKMFSNEVDYPKWYADAPKKDDSLSTVLVLNTQTIFNSL